MEKQYTNDITDDLIAEMNAPHSAEEIAPRALMKIWRFATSGALTRQGGQIERGSSDFMLRLADGGEVTKAMVGDAVIYPDGSRARIVSGAGRAATNGSGVSFALVGSQLDNGDEIISTPQNTALLCQWDNSPAMPDDFLIPVPASCPEVE